MFDGFTLSHNTFASHCQQDGEVVYYYCVSKSGYIARRQMNAYNYKLGGAPTLKLVRVQHPHTLAKRIQNKQASAGGGAIVFHCTHTGRVWVGSSANTGTASICYGISVSQQLTTDDSLAAARLHVSDIWAGAVVEGRISAAVVSIHSTTQVTMRRKHFSLTKPTQTHKTQTQHAVCMLQCCSIGLLHAIVIVWSSAQAAIPKLVV